MQAPPSETDSIPRSWYAETANGAIPFSMLASDRTVDVCVIGGGCTAESPPPSRWLSVAIRWWSWRSTASVGVPRDAVCTSQHRDQRSLERLVGKDDAQRLWDYAEEAKVLLRDRIARYRIACDYRPGT